MFNKRLCAILAIACLTLLGGSAFAEFGTIDQVPAATLLLPYFEVDSTAGGVNTLFSINNASAAPTIAHVVIWSDLSIPLLDFNVYLTGFDVQSVNLYDLFINGNLPSTADDIRDPADAISNDGAPSPIGDPLDVTIASCLGSLPLSTVPGLLQDRLIEGLQGNPTAFDGGCVGSPQGDGILRGYITVDNAAECSLDFPGDPGYFVNGNAIPVNQIWGDYFIVDEANAFAFGESLVHIEADPAYAAAGTVTFYGRYVAYNGEDQREALPNQFANRYLNGGPFDGGTDLLVWRDSGRPVPVPNAHACGNPAPYGYFPLNEEIVVAFDEEENSEELCTGTTTPVSPPLPGDPPCYPWETQRVSVGDDLEATFPFGWLYNDLTVPDIALVFDTQAWVVTQMSALGLYSVGFDAMNLNNITGSGPLSATP